MCLKIHVLILMCLWMVSINGAETTPEEETVNVEEGQTAVLPCTVPNLGTKTVVWRRQGSEFPITVGTLVYVSDARITVQQDGPNWNLLINNAATSDEGNFECHISGKQSVLVKKVKLEITQARGVNLTGTGYVNKYGLIHLVCTASGDNDAIDWFLDGQRINVSYPFWQGRVIVKEHLTTDSFISEMNIKPSRMDDAGIYVCRSSELQLASIAVHVINVETTTLSVTTTTQINDNTSPPAQDEMGTSDETDSSESEEVSEKMLKAAQLQFYREQILTGQKRRRMMRTEREFYRTMIRFLQEKEKENGQ